MAKSKAEKLTAKARKAKDKALKAASDHPLVAEIVAAALVGAAAALKNPAKAKALAASAADELKAASKTGDKQGGALWTLALDIARRSVSSLAEDAPKPPKAPKAPKAAKPAKPPKPPKPAKPAKAKSAGKKKKAG